MDKLIYTAMSGATRTMLAQQIRANNLANVNTNGFLADFERAKSYRVEGTGMQTQQLVTSDGTGSNFSAGALNRTDRNLDVAINGQGMFAVQVGDQERYTREGAFYIDANSRLMSGVHPVLDVTGQPIEIPEHQSLTISDAGKISINPGNGDSVLLEIATLKRVAIDKSTLVKGADGLFVSTSGDILPSDESIAVASGFLEASNVNPIEEMVSIMSLNRQFEMQVKMMKTAEKISETSTRLLRPT